MSFKELVLTGGKGGGGSFKNRPDNLRSTDSFEALIGVSSMRARLAPGGLQNLFVNDVPVEDGNGHSMLEDFTAVLFDGDPTQLNPIKLTLGSSAGPTYINLAVANSTDDGLPGPWVNGVVTQPGVDFIDLRFIVQSLYRQDKKGVYDLDANLEIEMRPSGTATWINPLVGTSAPTYNKDGFSSAKEAMVIIAQRARWNQAGTAWADSGSTVRIYGKTTSPYVKEVRIAVPNSGAYANKTWDVRVRLRERDYYVGGEDNLDEEHRDIVWESIAGVSQKPIGGTEAWRGLSYVQIVGKASDQINGVPEIKGIYDIGRYAVPPTSVFDAANQTYTGQAWDGVTTQIAWTQCPAWQIKGLIEDDLSGVSALVPGSTLNKWDALEASKWFAERVPDGRGGEQPRYTLNWIVEQPMQVNELVNYLAGAVGAFAWDEGDGRWRMKVEKPETPQMIFTKENIVGEFLYSHTDWDSRFNDITGVYRDRDNRYQENRVRTFDQPSIDQTGRRATTVVLVGCDNRQEALRRIELRKLTALKETRIVTFVTNRQGGMLEPFSVIGVADGDLNSSTAIRSTGRIVEMAGDRKSFRVRDSLRLEVGVPYQVQVTVPNPAYTPDTTTQPSDPNWRKPTITITRTIVNTAAQRGDVYELFLDQPLPASVPQFATIALSAVGLPALPKQYRVLAVVPGDDGETVSITASEIYTAKWVESDNVSEEAILSQIASKTVPPATAPASGMFVLKNFTTEFAERRLLSVNWQRPVLSLLDGYRVEMRHNGGPWQDLGLTKDTYYELQDPAHGTYQFRIYVRDRKGRESEPLTGTYDIEETPVGQTTPVAEVTPSGAIVPTAADGTGGNFTGVGGTFTIRNGMEVVPANQVAFSVVGNTPWISINASGQFSVVDPGVDSATATLRAVWKDATFEKPFTVTKAKAGQDGEDANSNNEPPPTPTGLSLASSIETGPDGKPWIKLTATWNPSSAPDLAGYTVAIKEGAGTFIEFSAGPLITSFYWSVQPNTTYAVKIRAHDTGGLSSAFSTERTLLTSKDIIPPSAPTGLAVAAAFQTMFLTWINPTDADLAFVEVWESPNSNGSGASRIAVVAASPGQEGAFGRTGLAPNTTRYYFLKAVDLAGNVSVSSAIVGKTTAFVAPLDISGQLTDAQVASVAAGKITGQLTDAQLQSIQAAKVAGQLTGAQIQSGAIAGTHFASGLTPNEIVDTLPTTGNFVGRVVMYRPDGKLYRYTYSGWSASVPTSDLSGKIAGTQITESSITSSHIAAYTITAGNIAANTITGGQIAADAISAGHIVAGAIGASEIAANAITAGHIAAGQITSTHIQAGQITGGHIAADTITSGNIAAGAITASELSAGSVQAGHIAAGQISAGHIVAGSITGDRLAANSITAGHIVAGQILAQHIAAGQISADKLNVASLSSISAVIGLLRTATSGPRTEIESNQIRVYGADGTGYAGTGLRLRMGVW